MDEVTNSEDPNQSVPRSRLISVCTVHMPACLKTKVHQGYNLSMCQNCLTFL